MGKQKIRPGFVIIIHLYGVMWFVLTSLVWVASALNTNEKCSLVVSAGVLKRVSIETETVEFCA